MIPVAPQPESTAFNTLVREKGKKFLKKYAGVKITSKYWKDHDYWNNIRIEFYHAYKGICAYSVHWIPLSSNPNIDHFIPKSQKPDLAYEWSNYRLACALINSFKTDHQVLDPFVIDRGWFILDFPSLLVKPGTGLVEKNFEGVKNTIEILKLNDDKLVHDRTKWLEPYCLGETSFTSLKRNAPFLAFELERQGLVEDIKKIMAYSVDMRE